tara:strand:+ start:1431 stop:2180 length:750 start_codon:yes stop_codon:yes gene_type:complete
MKVVILAGGLGSRIREQTKSIPKPMIEIKNKPIILRIMEHYSKYGYNDFIICGGYKINVIKNFFLNLNTNLSNELDIIYKENLIKTNLIKSYQNWNIKIVNTGLNSMTGGRLKLISKHLSEENFFFTYGDGISDVNIDTLLQSHKKSKKLVTVTAVKPLARFGEITIRNNLVTSFKEKQQTSSGWINGGFFVINKKFLKYIKNKNTILEKEPLEQVCKKKQLNAYKHNGFWQCVDTPRDLEFIEKLIKN